MELMKKLLVICLSVVMLLSILSGCGNQGEEANNEIVLLEGNYAETDIVIKMLGILIEKNTDLTVTYHSGMAYAPALTAIESGELDLMVSYDGSLLTSGLGYDPGDVPGGEQLFDWTKQKGIEDRGISMSGQFGFENTYALAIPRVFAEQNNIESTSDLVPFAPDLVFGAEHEWFDEEITVSANTFDAFYGFEWKESKSIDLGLKYTAIDNGNIDVTMVYTTDGLNKKFDLVILEDDRSFFPQYYGTFLLRDSLYEEYAQSAPNLEEIVTILNGAIDNETMIEMNYQVDSEGEDAFVVAEQFLKDQNLI